MVGISRSKTTYGKYRSVYQHLAEFIPKHYGRSDISFKEIDRKAYQLIFEKCASDAAVRYVTVLFPTTDAAAQSVEINTGEWSETGASISVRIDGKTYNLSYTLYT